MNAFVLSNAFEFECFLVKFHGSDLKRWEIGSFFVIFGPHLVSFIEISFFKVQTEFIPLCVEHFLVFSIFNFRFGLKLLKLLNSTLLFTLKFLKIVSCSLLSLNLIKLLVCHGFGVTFWWSLKFLIIIWSCSHWVFLCELRNLIFKESFVCDLLVIGELFFFWSCFLCNDNWCWFNFLLLVNFFFWHAWLVFEFYVNRNSLQSRFHILIIRININLPKELPGIIAIWLLFRINDSHSFADTEKFVVCEFNGLGSVEETSDDCDTRFHFLFM